MQTKFNVQFINGIRGASAYEVALRNGFRGTEQEWLSSLKGDQGIQGEKGDKGDKGDKGEKGADGYTPVKGTDYFTEADKAEIINEISASGGGTGGGGTSGGDENWELIASSDEVIEGADFLILTEDNNGTPFKLKKAMFFLWTSKSGDYGYLSVGISPKNYNWLCSAATNQGNKTFRFLFEKEVDGNWGVHYSWFTHDKTTLLPTTDESLRIGRRKNFNDDFLTCVNVQLQKATAIKYVLYGVRG